MIGFVALTILFQAPDLMTYEEYAQVEHSRPYVLRIQTRTAAILYFGIGHTRNPEDPQLKTARDLWREFQPEAAFHEDSSPRAQPSLEESVRIGGEPAWVAFMAKSDGIPLASLDPGRAPEAAFLAKKFDPATVKAMYVLRNIHEYRKRPVESQTRPVDQVADLNLLRLALTANLKGKPRNAQELREVLAETVGRQAKIEEPQSDWFDPGMPKVLTKFHEVARASSQFRDRHMIQEIVKLVRGGKRAFIVMGASHVVMQEPAIRAALPNAKIDLLMGR